MRAAIFSFSVFALVAFVLAPAANALSDSEIERFAASMSDVQEWSDARSEELKEAQADVSEAFQGGMMNGPTEEQKKIMEAPMSYSVNQMDNSSLKSELAVIVAKHGFSSPESWAAIGDQVMKAYVALQMEGERNYSAEIQQAMDQIRNNPHLSAAQKDEMMRMMGGASAAADIMSDVPQEDIEAVRPHKDTLDAVMQRQANAQ